MQSQCEWERLVCNRDEEKMKAIMVTDGEVCKGEGWQKHTG